MTNVLFHYHGLKAQHSGDFSCGTLESTKFDAPCPPHMGSREKNGAGEGTSKSSKPLLNSLKALERSTCRNCFSECGTRPLALESLIC